ncbi:transglycosylase family protein [Kytococcus sp. Marseille-QA3725]
MFTIALTAPLGVVTSVEPPTATVWDRVAQCESLGRSDAHPSDSARSFHFFGGLQFSQTTWEGVGGLAWAPRADLATRAEQIAAARRLLAMQGPQAWPTCGPRAGLTKASGGADPDAVPAG